MGRTVQDSLQTNDLPAWAQGYASLLFTTLRFPNEVWATQGERKAQAPSTS